MNYKSVGILVLVACLVSTATATGASKKNLVFKGNGKRISAAGGVDLDSKDSKESDSKDDGTCGGLCDCQCIETVFDTWGKEAKCNGTTLADFLNVTIAAGDNFADVGEFHAGGFCLSKVEYKDDFKRADLGCACSKKRLFFDNPDLSGIYLYCNDAAQSWFPYFKGVANQTEALLADPKSWCGDAL
eukprot:171262_1